MYVHRELEKEIAPFLEKKEVIAIIGARQTGKTTLLEYLLTLFQNQKKSVKYITFEKTSDLELFNNIEDFKEIHKIYDVLIIDEFQYAKEGGKKLKYLFDTTQTKYIISGSSSLEIIYKTGKFMVGRIFTFILRPFSFKEYLSYKDKELFEVRNNKITDVLSEKFNVKDIFSDPLNEKLEKLFEEYLIFGGYPAVVLTKNEEVKIKVLESIFENYLLKDIRSLLRLATEQNLIRLVKFLSTQIGNLIDYNELSEVTGLHYKKLLSHIEILKQTYIIDLLPPYFKNKRTELIKNPKVYFNDTGFRNLAISDFRKLSTRNDAGMLAENYVHSALSKRVGTFENLNFWRTKSKAEIDFILQLKDQIVPIEVKYSNNPSIGKSFYSFVDKYTPSNGFVLNKKFAAEKIISGCRIKFVPMYYL